MGQDLSIRQKSVLITIVERYINTHKPISSDDVLKNSKISASSATIRNDMQKLQKLKYIFQQHTSGGRIPTDKALKLYFEVINDLYKKKNTEIDIPKEYKFYDLNLMFDNMAKLLSKELNCLTIFEYPDPKYVRITRIVVTPLTSYHCVVTIMTNLGMTISRTVEIYGLPNPEELENMLNNGLLGKTLDDIYAAFQMQNLNTDDIRIINMFKLINNLLNEFSRNKYIINGLEKIIAKHEPTGETIETLAMIIENEKLKEQIFSELKYNREINLFFGGDMNSRALRNYSFFYTSYYLSSNPLGRIIIITYKYSNYEKIYKRVKEYVSRFSEIISKNL